MLMEFAGLSPDALADPDSRVKAASMLKLWRAVIDGLNDQSLGLHIGNTIRATELGLVGYAIYHSRNLQAEPRSGDEAAKLPSNLSGRAI